MEDKTLEDMIKKDDCGERRTAIRAYIKTPEGKIYTHFYNNLSMNLDAVRKNAGSLMYYLFAKETLKLLEQKQKELEAEQEKNRWRNVNEELPEENCYCLLWYKSKEDIKSQKPTLAIYNKEDNFFHTMQGEKVTCKNEAPYGGYPYWKPITPPTEKPTAKDLVSSIEAMDSANVKEESE